MKILPPSEWTATIEQNPDIPRDAQSLRERILTLRQPIETFSAFLCFTADWDLVFTGLLNPGLDEDERESLTQLADPLPPEGLAIYRSTHFNLYYEPSGITEKIIKEMGDNLESSLQSYFKDFNNISEMTGVPVIFDTNGRSHARPPNDNRKWGSIVFDAGLISEANTLGRKCAAAHELFHLVQFAFKVRASTADMWMVEGTATWAEAHYCKGVHSAARVNFIFDENVDQNFSLNSLEYDALPFWIFLDNWLGHPKKALPMAEVLDRFQAGPNATALAVDDAIANLEPGKGLSYALVLFGTQMATGAWYGGRDPLKDTAPAEPVYIPWPNLALPPSQKLTIANTDVAWVGPLVAAQSGCTIFELSLEDALPGDDLFFDVSPSDLGENSYVGVWDGESSSPEPVYVVNTIEQRSIDGFDHFFVVFGGGPMSTGRYSFYFGRQAQGVNQPFDVTGSGTSNGTLENGIGGIDDGNFLIKRTDPEPPNFMTVGTPMDFLPAGSVLPNISWIRATRSSAHIYSYAVRVYGGGPTGIGFTRLLFTDQTDDTYSLRLRAVSPKEHEVSYNSKKPKIIKVTWS